MRPDAMSDEPSSVSAAVARLEAWRAQGSDRVDPVRFRFLESMARRAGANDGAARRVLEARIDALMAAYGEAIERVPDTRRGIEVASPARGPLGELVARVARFAPTPSSSSSSSSSPTRSPATPASLAPPELGDLAHFRRTWSRLSAAKRMTQALAEAPPNAGPLNSQHLVHRSLALMRDLSPAYLEHFVAHVDALLWLEQANAVPAERKAGRGRAS